MLRSMMQVYVKDSVQAAKLYQSAFNGELLCAYPDENGGYAHAELNLLGQVVAVSELGEEAVPGNTMQFCFHLGPGGEEQVKQAYEALREGAQEYSPVGPCDYSPCQFFLRDKFGVNWCVFV